MGYLAESYRDLNPLKTDMYQLTMSQGYFDQGRQDEEVSFYMHWRNPPFNGGYTMAAGLEGVVDFLRNFKFKPEDITYLRSIEKKGKPLFSEAFLNYLATTDLQLDVDAIPEGTVMTGQGPVIRVRGPLAQAQLVESAILNIVNSASIVTTRASRLVDVGDGRPVADFSLRRAGTMDSAVGRASFIGGITAVADVDAARKLGIPPTGTMAHAFIMGFKAAIEGYNAAKKAGHGERWISPYYKSADREFYEQLVRDTVDAVYPNVGNSEIELVAFKAYLKSMPTNSVLLIDTFDPVQGIKNAIRSAIEMNVELDGIRLDSGDLYALSWEGRRLIDEAKKDHPQLFATTRIVATDGLDEAKIDELQKRSLVEKNAPLPIDVYGVGTELGNPGPLRGGVYKVSATEIIRENFETTVNADGKAETILVNGESIPFTRDMLGTMKIAGINKEDPSLPGPKSSMPGAMLDTLRLFDANGKQVADIIIDQSLRSVEDWQKLIADKQAGIIVDAAGTLIDVSNVASAESLLKPIFRAGQYVYNEHGAPPLKPAYKGGPDVTDLSVIQSYARTQREQLHEGTRRFNNPEIQPILMDPLVLEQRRAIMAEMSPGIHTSGDMAITQNKKIGR